MDNRVSVRVEMSPDFQDIVKYLNSMLERVVASGNAEDQRIKELMETFSRATGDQLIEFERTEAAVSFYPSDLLLDLAAKFRAVERVLSYKGRL